MKAGNLYGSLILAALFFTPLPGGLRAQNADEIINKHIAAMGGIDNWNKINSMILTSSASTPVTEITLIQTVVKDKGMRMDIKYMGINGYTIVTPTDGWIYTPFGQGMDKVTEMPPADVKASQGKLDVKNGLLLDKTDIQKAAYIGKDSLNNILCYKLKITDKTGNEQTAFFDTATYYMVRTEIKIQTEGQAQEMAVNYSNFQKQQGGIVYPMALTSQEGNFTIKAIEINKPIDMHIFTPDAAVETKK